MRNTKQLSHKYLYMYLYLYIFSCGVGASRELLGEGELRSLPECQHPDRNVCRLSETRGIEVQSSFSLYVHACCYM